jgi:hypothetical protein
MRTQNFFLKMGRINADVNDYSKPDPAEVPHCAAASAGLIGAQSANATFLVHHGLNGVPGTVSFESALYPDHWVLQQVLPVLLANPRAHFCDAPAAACRARLSASGWFNRPKPAALRGGCGPRACVRSQRGVSHARAAQRAASWLIRPAMSGTADLVSLESADKPGFFIRLDNHTMQARARRARAWRARAPRALATLTMVPRRRSCTCRRARSATSSTRATPPSHWPTPCGRARCSTTARTRIWPKCSSGLRQ